MPFLLLFQVFDKSVSHHNYKKWLFYILIGLDNLKFLKKLSSFGMKFDVDLVSNFGSQLVKNKGFYFLKWTDIAFSEADIMYLKLLNFSLM